MKELDLKELEQVSGGIDDTTKDILDVIGKIAEWFENL